MLLEKTVAKIGKSKYSLLYSYAAPMIDNASLYFILLSMIQSLFIHSFSHYTLLSFRMQLEHH